MRVYSSGLSHYSVLNNSLFVRAEPLTTDPSRLIKRSVVIAGHSTSVSMENIFWQALKDIARLEGLSINALITQIDKTRTGNLSSAIRVFVTQRLMEQKSL